MDSRIRGNDEGGLGFALMALSDAHTPGKTASCFPVNKFEMAKYLIVNYPCLTIQTFLTERSVLRFSW